MYNKVYDKIVDGAEYQLIKCRHFIRNLKKAGFSLSYNEEACIKDLFNHIVKETIDIMSLEKVIKTLGIEDEKPPFNKHLNYSQLNPSSIKLFNKINQRVEETD